MRIARQVIRNALLLLGGDLAGMALRLALTIVIARRLGSAELGKLAYMMALVNVLTVVADLGLSPFYVRAAQRDPGGSLLGAVLAVRSLSTLIAAAALALYAATLSDRPVGLLLQVGSLILLFTVIPSWTTTYLRAREKMAYEGVTKAIGSLLTTAGGVMVITAGGGVAGVAIVMAVVAFGLTVYFGWLGYRATPRPLRLLQALPRYVEVVRGAWAFASVSVLVTIYFRIDSLMLFAMKGQEALGQYSAAYRVMEGALLVPWTMSSSMLPPVARFIAHRSGEVIRASQKALHFLLAISIPAAVFGAMFAPQLFSVLYGRNFAEAAQIFRILAFTLIAVFASSVTSTLISAGPRPVVNTLIALVMVVLNIGLNLILIPRWSGSGAAVATVATEGTGLVLGTLYIQRAIAPLTYLGEFTKPALATLVGAVLAYAIPSLMVLPACCVLYAVVLWALRGVTPEDVSLVKELVARSDPMRQSAAGA